LTSSLLKSYCTTRLPRRMLAYLSPIYSGKNSAGSTATAFTYTEK
jgi:hypothetical protein